MSLEMWFQLNVSVCKVLVISAVQHFRQSHNMPSMCEFWLVVGGVLPAGVQNLFNLQLVICLVIIARVLRNKVWTSLPDVLLWPKKEQIKSVDVLPLIYNGIPCGNTFIQTAAPFQYSHDKLLSLYCRNWECSQSPLKFSTILGEQLYPRRYNGLHRRHCSPGGTAARLWQKSSSAFRMLMPVSVHWEHEESSRLLHECADEILM